MLRPERADPALMGRTLAGVLSSVTGGRADRHAAGSQHEQAGPSGQVSSKLQRCMHAHSKLRKATWQAHDSSSHSVGGAYGSSKGTRQPSTAGPPSAQGSQHAPACTCPCMRFLNRMSARTGSSGSGVEAAGPEALAAGADEAESAGVGLAPTAPRSHSSSQAPVLKQRNRAAALGGMAGHRRTVLQRRASLLHRPHR